MAMGGFPSRDGASPASAGDNPPTTSSDMSMNQRIIVAGSYRLARLPAFCEFFRSM